MSLRLNIDIHRYEKDDAYITWIVNDTAAWTIKAGAVGADTKTEISARPVPQEPMVRTLVKHYT